MPSVDDDGATAASAATEVGASGDGGQPAAKRACSSAGGAVSAAAAAASAPAASAATGAVAAPPTTIAGGYSVGDEVFFAGPGLAFPSGDRLVYGGKGEIAGPACPDAVAFNPGFAFQFVTVWFPGNQCAFNCDIINLSRTPLPATLLGGYRVGNEAFYTGPGLTFPSGDRLVYGGKGEVTGPGKDSMRLSGVSVVFPGHPFNVVYLLDVLSRTAPPPR